MLAGINGKVGPHGLRRTFVTLALNRGLTPRRIVAATGHNDERTISRYDRGREYLDINAINFHSLAYPASLNLRGRPAENGVTVLPVGSFPTRERPPNPTRVPHTPLDRVRGMVPLTLAPSARTSLRAAQPT
jgi:hypothetical protein